MKMPFNIRAPSFDAHAIHETIRSALASAGLDTKSGPMLGVSDTLRRARSATAARPPSTEAPQVPAGEFSTCRYANRAGALTYKLHMPPRAGAAPLPLVVMLHGCTQSADDFAAGTRMNRLADEHGFLVVYPEQASSANPSKCWNWFQAQDQVRDSGEPALIAGIVREVAASHGVDMRRIFVAGLSAGAAMAVILGETYPELFAGVGAHSGLPYRSAHDIPSAMAAMKGGRSGIAGQKTAFGSDTPARRQIAHAVPTIVFHGDRDHTVQQTNGIEIVQQAANAHSADAADVAMSERVERGTSPGGRSFSRSVQADATGQTRIESWTVHGAGHAWSGGSASGTYTDPSGPDASAEMARFFLSLPRRGTG